MINEKKTSKIHLYPSIQVKTALDKAAKAATKANKGKVSASSLGSEIITEWLVKNGYLKTVNVRVPDLG